MANAQDFLQKKVVITIQNEPVALAIEQLSRVGQFDFAYASGTMDAQRRVSFQANGHTVAQVLSNILTDPSVRYKAIGSQLVIYRHKGKNILATQNKVNGKVIDAANGRAVAGALVLEPGLGLRAVSDATGHFELLVPNPDIQLRLSISSPQYETKWLKVGISQDNILRIALMPRSEPAASVSVSVPDIPSIAFRPVETTKIANFLLAESVRERSEQVSQLRRATWQVGLVPPISSSFGQSGQQVNRFSFNVLAGYSAGLRGVEFGGMLNIDRYNVRGIQVAGFGNLVGGRTDGVQFAGFSNVTLLQGSGWQVAGFSNFISRDFDGWQFSGFSNIVGGTFRGVQLSGFHNLSRREGRGVQFSGFANVATGQFEGWQAAGFANTAVQNFGGVQFAGFANTASGFFEGGQAAGFANFSRKGVRGVQFAGFINIGLKEVKGVQASGFMNFAGNLHGVQIGVINFADTVSKGLPIGLLNFVVKGYRRIELSVSENETYFLSFKTGIPRFYNILVAGFKPEQVPQQTMGAGYGFGTLFGHGKRFEVALEGTAMQMFERIQGPIQLNIVSTARLTVGVRIGKRFVCYGGPALNFQVFSPSTESNGLALSALAKRPFYAKLQADGNWHYRWWGYSAGIRF